MKFGLDITGGKKPLRRDLIERGGPSEDNI
jgi:hypothetical protein